MDIYHDKNIRGMIGKKLKKNGNFYAKPVFSLSVYSSNFYAP